MPRQCLIFGGRSLSDAESFEECRGISGHQPQGPSGGGWCDDVGFQNLFQHSLSSCSCWDMRLVGSNNEFCFQAGNFQQEWIEPHYLFCASFRANGHTFQYKYLQIHEDLQRKQDMFIKLCSFIFRVNQPTQLCVRKLIDIGFQVACKSQCFGIVKSHYKGSWSTNQISWNAMSVFFLLGDFDHNLHHYKSLKHLFFYTKIASIDVFVLVLTCGSI